MRLLADGSMMRLRLWIGSVPLDDSDFPEGRTEEEVGGLSYLANGTRQIGFRVRVDGPAREKLPIRDGDNAGRSGRPDSSGRKPRYSWTKAANVRTAYAGWLGQSGV